MSRQPSITKKATLADRDSLLRVLKRAELDTRRPAAERDALVKHLREALKILVEGEQGRSEDASA